MSPVHQVWPKPSCKAQWKGEEGKADKGRVWKTTSRNGQAWSLASPRRQWRTGENGENWLQNHLWCPNYPRGRGIDDDNDDDDDESLFILSVVLACGVRLASTGLTGRRSLNSDCFPQLWNGTFSTLSMLLLSVLSWRVSQYPHQLKMSPGTWSVWLSQAFVCLL